MKQASHQSINLLTIYYLFFLSLLIYLLICFISLTGNYRDSLNDAKVAIALQPCYVKAIVRGTFS